MQETFHSSTYHFSLTCSLHPSLSLYLPSLPAERQFSSTPRLNFLTVLIGCQSRPASPARKPPSDWASDSHTNLMPLHCPFVKPMISAGSFPQNRLALFPPSSAASAHRKWLYPCGQTRISFRLPDFKRKSCLLWS